MIASGRAAATASRTARASSTSSTIGSAPSARSRSAFLGERERAGHLVPPLDAAEGRAGCRSHRWLRRPVLAYVLLESLFFPCPGRALVDVLAGALRRCLGRARPVRAFVAAACHIGRVVRVTCDDTWQREDVTDGRERVAGGALRGAPGPSAGGGLPDAGLAHRRRRRRAGHLAAAQPGRGGRGREPRRVADDDRRPGVPEHAALAQRPARGALGAHVPDPVISPDGGSCSRRRRRCWPTRSALRCWSCSTPWTPAERLAFVLHDMFELPFEEIAPMVGRTPAAAQAARQPGTAPGEGRRGTGAGPRSRPPTRGGRRLLRGGARRRLRRPRRRARPRCRAANRRGRPAPRGLHGDPRRSGRGRAGSPRLRRSRRGRRAAPRAGERSRRGGRHHATGGP